MNGHPIDRGLSARRRLNLGEIVLWEIHGPYPSGTLPSWPSAVLRLMPLLYLSVLAVPALKWSSSGRLHLLRPHLHEGHSHRLRVHRPGVLRPHGVLVHHPRSLNRPAPRQRVDRVLMQPPQTRSMIGTSVNTSSPRGLLSTRSQSPRLLAHPIGHYSSLCAPRLGVCRPAKFFCTAFTRPVAANSWLNVVENTGSELLVVVRNILLNPRNFSIAVNGLSAFTNDVVHSRRYLAYSSPPHRPLVL